MADHDTHDHTGVPGVGASTAADVSITDSGGYFTGTDVEAALQELGAGGGGGGGATDIGWIDAADNPDKPPASPNAIDDEFDTGSLNVKWTNVDSRTLAFAASRLIVTNVADSDVAHIRQAFAPGASTAFTLRAKFVGCHFGSTFDRFGIAVLDSSDASIAYIDIREDSSGFIRQRGPGPSNQSLQREAGAGIQYYLELSRDASNVYKGRHSYDGVTWQLLGETGSTVSTAVAKLEIYGSSRANTEWSCDWIRRTV